MRVIRIESDWIMKQSFKSEEIRVSAGFQGIDLHFSPIKSHNSIGEGESYHDRLQRIFEKLRR